MILNSTPMCNLKKTRKNAKKREKKTLQVLEDCLRIASEKKRCGMEVDKEPMDLNNSSRVNLATTDLVDSPIFITFYFVFRYFLFCFTLTAPHTILHIHTFTPFYLFT